MGFEEKMTPEEIKKALAEIRNFSSLTKPASEEIAKFKKLRIQVTVDDGNTCYTRETEIINGVMREPLEYFPKTYFLYVDKHYNVNEKHAKLIMESAIKILKGNW